MNTSTRLLVAALSLSAGAALAADPVQGPGRQFMTEQERIEMRDRMRNATTDEERARLRAEMHALQRERAAAQGIVLPETPPAQGQGMGAGRNRSGSTGGMGGQGRGMGRGMGAR